MAALGLSVALCFAPLSFWVGRHVEQSAWADSVRIPAWTLPLRSELGSTVDAPLREEAALQLERRLDLLVEAVIVMNAEEQATGNVAIGSLLDLFPLAAHLVKEPVDA
jgi:hypothetical protein